jgi:signal transduction histidine kinase
MRATLVANVTRLAHPLTAIKGADNPFRPSRARSPASSEYVGSCVTTRRADRHGQRAARRHDSRQARSRWNPSRRGRTIVQEAAAGFSAGARATSPRGPGAEARIAADRKVSGALENLVSNALKFTDDDGQVIVEVTVAGDAVGSRAWHGQAFPR